MGGRAVRPGVGVGELLDDGGFLLRRKRWDEGLGFQEREMFAAFLSLPAPQRKAVREIILGLATGKNG